MTQYDRYGQKKNRKNNFFAPLIFVGIVVLAVFVVGVFFRVQNIEVIGAQTYTAQEVVEASGVEIGDNLFFINRFSASSSIFTKLPFVDAASIEREMPNTIIITVEESSAAAYISWQGQDWLLSAGGKFLGSAEQEQLSSIIKITGFEPLSPTVGETISVEAADELRLQYLLDLLSVIQNDGLLDSVKEICLTVDTNASLDYLGRFTVRMGPNTDLDYKLRMLLATVRQLEAGETGTIDLSDGETVYFSAD